MKSAYRVLAGLIVLGVFVQAAAIAFGWFDAIKEMEDGGVLDKDWKGNAGHMVHGMNGMMVIPILALLLFIVSFFAKIPGGVKWAGLTLLAVVVQVALAITAFSLPAVGALHGMNALVIVGMAITALRKATVAAPSVRTDTSESVGARAV